MSRHPSDPSFAELYREAIGQVPGWAAQVPAAADKVDAPPPDPEIERTRSLFVQRATEVERQAVAHLQLDLRWAAVAALMADTDVDHAVARAGGYLWTHADDQGVYRGSAADMGRGLGIGRSAAHELAVRLTRTGWATRRADGHFVMHHPSVRKVKSGSPGRPAQPRKTSGSPGQNARLTRTPTPLRGVGDARAPSGAAPGVPPEQPQAARHIPDEAERARVAALIEQAKRDRDAQARAKAERLDLE